MMISAHRSDGVLEELYLQGYVMLFLKDIVVFKEKWRYQDLNFRFFRIVSCIKLKKIVIDSGMTEISTV